jgi:SecD/SecF fusion protein
VRQATEDGLVPEDKVILFSKRPNPWDSVKRYQLYLLDKEPLMTGEGLTQAVARQDPQSLDGSYHIMFELNAASGRRFGEVTEANTGRNMAIVVDNVVESAPVIREKISGSGVISGRFSMEESRDLAIALSSGSMPAPIREDFTGVVGASLGADSVRKGVFSAMVGMILVVIFMIAYYRMAGVIANIALLFNAITIVAVMAYFNATLTLPGIAGLILTIGMAVDANVLIYERIREEIRNGRSILASIDNGFARARITILDANVTTLIAAAVLMQFGTGPIEGFAVTLMIGVVTSVFAALVVSRAVFDLLAARGLLGKLTMTSIFKAESKVGFLEKRRIAGMLSLAVIAIGVIAFGVRQANPPGMFGVDFTTGTNMVVNLHGDTRVDVGSVRGELAKVGYADAIVQRYDQGDDADLNRFMIRIPLVETAPTDGEAAQEAVTAESDTVSSKVQQALEALAAPASSEGITPVELEQVETVGPAVGKQLLVDAISAIIYSMIFIVIYLWFRFELKFALGAVAALVHDVLITLAVFALLQRQISLNVVAALLTIIGYSLNDTIVVFDRIREDMRLYRGRSLSYLEIMNLSINQTLSRTILTSATTLIVVLILFLFGGPVINDFALALLTGVIVGTYSSIFIASPVAYYIQKFQGRNAGATAADTKNQGGRRRRRRSSESTPEAPAES